MDKCDVIDWEEIRHERAIKYVRNNLGSKGPDEMVADLFDLLGYSEKEALTIILEA